MLFYIAGLKPGIKEESNFYFLIYCFNIFFIYILFNLLKINERLENILSI